MKVLTVVGARPNFMKVAPIVAEITRHNGRVSAEALPAQTIQHVLVHTGQHYGELMSDSFFRDLRIPAPDVQLDVGSGSHAVQTAQIMTKFEAVLLTEKPDVVMVVGDVNSTLACALVTAKIAFDGAGTRPVIVHVEAGLRSFDPSMPEEINRVLTDHLADVLLVTEESGLRNLRYEGVAPERIHLVGNTMIDCLLAFKDTADASTILEEFRLTEAGTNRRYAVLTLHRPSNVDRRDALLDILAGLEELATEIPIVFPVHPRTRRRIQQFGLEFGLASHARNSTRGLVLTEPRGYLDFLCLLKHATLVVTDSGGVQEETTCLGIPCVTVRENTERPVTVESGTNIVAGTVTASIRNAIRRQMVARTTNVAPPKWDGRAAERIVDVLLAVDRQQALANGGRGGDGSAARTAVHHRQAATATVTV